MTFLESLPRKDLGEIRPISIKLYLKAMGWNKIVDDSKGIAVFRDPHNTIEVQIPNIENTRMYPIMMEQAVAQISRFQQRSAIEVMNEIPYRAPSDIFKIRIPDEETENGAITFERAIELIQSAKEMLVSTACTIYNPVTYHRRLQCRYSDEVVNTMRVGQSERGSYVARIICPMAVTAFTGQSDLLDFDMGNLAESISETETRRVTSNLMRSADFVTKSIRNEDNYNINRIFDREGEDPIISANFVQAMQDLEPVKEGTEVEFHMVWAGGVKPKLETPTKVEILKEDFELLPRIIEKLTPQNQQIEDEFVGKIRQTREVDEGDLDNNSLSEFVFVTDYNDKLISAKVLFYGEDRRLAHLASTERYYVKVKGKLTKIKRTYFIENAKIHTFDET